MATTATATTETPCAGWSKFDDFGETVRKAREAVNEGRAAADHLKATAMSELKEHPLRTAAIATAVGAVAGCAFGLLMGWRVSAARTDREWLKWFVD